MSLFVPREKPLTSLPVGLLINAGVLFLSLLVGAILMTLMDASPLAGYRELVFGMVGSQYNIIESLIKATPLLIISLGIAIAFRASVWNIGAEGQFYIGALCATWIGLQFSGLPGILIIALAMAGSILAGGMWGGIAGFLRARYNINEIIVTMMMNYIAIYFLRFMVQGPMRETASSGGGNPQTDLLVEAAWLPKVFAGTRLHIGFLLALLLVGVVYFVMKSTVFGYHLKAVGKNPLAARFAGINIDATIIRAIVISGALAGLAGFIEVYGVRHRLLDGISPGYGYTAIIVALLGRQNPLGILASSGLLASLEVGARVMQRGIAVPVSLVVIIEYLVVILIFSVDILRTHQFALLRKILKRGQP